MAYRGRDLDLRVPQDNVGQRDGGPQTSGAATGHAQHNRQGGDATFLVDDTVLACFNHAYDIAAAHSAAEVRIAHLLLAATRISETAVSLQARGIEVPQLMRDTAAVVASQFPNNTGNGSTAPKASYELEDVLRHAAAYADRQAHPINADDLVNVLFEIKSEVAGIELLDRSSDRFETRGSSTVRETPRERIRMPAGSSQYGYRQTVRTAVPNSATDSIQDARIETLEQMVRALSEDLAYERQTYGTTDPLPEPPAPQTPYVEYDRYPETAPAPRETFVAPPPAPAYDQGMADRSEALMHEMGRLNGRLGNIEKQLSRFGDGNVDVDVAPLLDRLDAVDGTIRELVKDRSHDMSDVADRISDLETLISDRGSVDVDLKPVLDRLDVIEEGVVNGGGDPTDVANLIATSAELMHSNSAVTSELKALDDRVAAQAVTSDRTMTRLVERFEGFSADVMAQRSDLTKSLSEMQALLAAEINRDREDTSEFVHEVGQVHEALMKLNANQHTLATSIETWREAGARDMSIMTARMDTVVVEAGRPMQMLETMSVNMEGMYRATVERYHRRNRIWYWLFGTDDWVSASWPSASARVEADRRGMRT